jgi:hypothetical protein
MNRFTILFLGIALPFATFSQRFGPIQGNVKPPLPAVNAKSSLLVPQRDAASTLAQDGPAVPICAFDLLNEWHSQTDPDYQKQMQHYIEEVVPMLSQLQGQEKSTVQPLITISVSVHVIHNGVPVGQGQNISAAQIQAQLDILNEDFAALNSQFFNTPAPWLNVAGVPNIEFCLASVDPSGNPTNGITRHNLQVTGSTWNNNNINSVIKPLTKWDPTRYMNIYVLPIPGTTAAGGVVGFANYPTPSLVGSSQDGIVVDYRWFGAPGYPVSGWKTLTHETGHYLGLPHPFNGNSCSSDDGIADTPNIDKSTRDYATLNCGSGFPQGPASCGNEHLYVNYMDYVTENCYTSFTQGQVNLMRAVLNGTSSGFNYGSRNALVQNAPLLCNIPQHDAGITRIIEPSPVSCQAAALVPQVTLRNFGSANLTTASIRIKVGSQPTVVVPWTGNLFPGQSVNLSLPAYTPPSGLHTINVYTVQPNGQADQRLSNDTTGGAFQNYVPQPPPMSEDFEGEQAFPVSTGLYQVNFDGDDFQWNLSSAASAFGNGSRSVVFDNYAGSASNNPYGTIDALITRHFDFSGTTGAELKFDVAYAQVDNVLSDTLAILVATNCSQNFNQLIYLKGGSQLATAPNTQQAFIPQNSQWRTETIDLSQFNGFSDVTIAFVNVSGWGNRLYIDNMRLAINCSQLTHEVLVTPNRCDDGAGACSGTVSVAMGNHNGGLQYSWEGFPGNNQPMLPGVCPQTVSVTVTDAFGCQVITSGSVVQAVPPDLELSSTQVSTYAGSDGTASAIAQGGSGPYDFFWSNGYTDIGNASGVSVATGLQEGNYAVTVVDQYGCERFASILISSVCSSFLAVLQTESASCPGESDGEAAVSVVSGIPPYTYSWGNGASSASLSSLSSGLYMATVTNGNGCPLVLSGTVSEPLPLELELSSTGLTVSGQNDGTASVTVAGGTPGYAFAWSNGGTSSVLSGLSPGDYFVTVTDQNGCTSSGSVTVNEVSCAAFLPQVNIQQISCHGLDDGQASVFVPGNFQGLTYEWSNGVSGAANASLQPGTYFVTVSDLNECAATLSVNILEPPLLVAVASSTAETAVNANNGTATVQVMGGTGITEYIWSIGESSPSIYNLAPGVYSVTITDQNGCTATSSVAVAAYSCAIQIQGAYSAASCPDTEDGSAYVSAISGGTWPFVYSWSNGDSSFVITGVGPGAYSVTISDASGCSASQTVEVLAADLIPPVVLTKNAALSVDVNGMAEVTGGLVDGGSYDNCGTVSIEVVPALFTCDDIGQQVVTVIVTDEAGNSASSQAVVTIFDQAPPVITCPGDTTVSECGPVVYPLPVAVDACNSATVAFSSGVESGGVFSLGVTPVTWTASDALGNSASCQFYVTVSSSLSVEAVITNPACFGSTDGAIDLITNGGTPPYTFEWAGGINPQTLGTGVYYVTVTDAGGCSLSQTLEVIQPDPLLLGFVGATPASPGLSDGSVSYVVNGGTAPYTLTWYDSNNQLLPDFDTAAVSAGAYRVIVTDSLGCVFESVYVTVNQLSDASYQLWQQRLSIFPNPTSGHLFVEMGTTAQEQAEMAVFDGRGVERIRMPFRVSSSNAFDLSWLASGTYWLRITCGERVAMRKIVIVP